MYKNLLPIGSVVLMKGGKQRVMITGRVLTRAGDATVYDYAGCRFPQGVGADNTLFFNRDLIDRVFFLGLQDEEELAYEEYLARIDHVEMKEGRLVPVMITK